MGGGNTKTLVCVALCFGAIHPLGVKKANRASCNDILRGVLKLFEKFFKRPLKSEEVPNLIRPSKVINWAAAGNTCSVP